jgi:hypothetical protein
MPLTALNQQGQPYPVIYGHILYTGWTIVAVGSTIIVPSAPPGIYRYSGVLIITTAQASDAITVNGIWTDDLQAETVAIFNGTSTASTGQFSASILAENTATANLSYSVTTTATSAVANLYLVVERIY